MSPNYICLGDMRGEERERERCMLGCFMILRWNICISASDRL